MNLYTITGGAGFIGSHLADTLLARGHQVRVLDDISTGRVENLDPRCTLIRADVRDGRAVRAALEGASGCFHLAAIASVERANQDWLGTHSINLGGTITVLDAARALGGMPVVYASSAAVYGDLTGTADEARHPQPLTAYGADKLGSELHAAVAFGVHAVPSLGLRFFNVYGPRQDPRSPYSGVISIFAGRAAEGQTITVHGDGSQTRDFVFVGDVVNHLAASMEQLHDRPPHMPGATVLNVCTGRATSILALARMIMDTEALPYSLIVHGCDRPGDIRQSVGDPAAAIARLGLRAGVTLADGLSRTMSVLRLSAVSG